MINNIMMKTILFALLTFLAISCDDETKKTPCENNRDWLQQKIKKFENNEVIGFIDMYEYNNEEVFFIDNCYQCADAGTYVYNCKGENICTFGTLLGLNTCPDFNQKAKFVKNIIDNRPQ